MSVQPAEPGPIDKAVDSFTDAKRAVESATEQVVEVGQHVKRAVRSARQRPGSALRMLEQTTRSAPLAMLGLAFIAGAMLFGRRR